MGIFLMDDTRYENNYNVIANESYSGVEGAMQILIDGARNDQALFEAMIASDMTEIDLINCNESAEVYALNESTASGIFERIKEFFKKMWEKLKGVILSFINKLKAKMTSDNAKLVSKYGNDVRKKTFGKNFTYKYAEPQSNPPDKDFTKIKQEIEKVFNIKALRQMTDDDVKEIEKEISSGKALKEMLAFLSGAPNVTSDNFDEKFHKKMFKNEKECRGLDSGRLSNIMKALENSNEAISDAKELQSDLDEFCKDLIDFYDELADEYASKEGDKKADKDDKFGSWETEKDVKVTKGTPIYDIQNPGRILRYKDIITYDDKIKKDHPRTNAQATKLASLSSKMASVIQTACTKYTSAYLKEIKFGIAQDRKVFIKAVAWRESQNESYEDSSILFNAIDESVDYELSDLI